MKIFLILLLASILFSKIYDFAETRYSDALNKERKLEGIIDFSDKGLSIKYKKAKTELYYKNAQLRYLKDGKEIELKQQQSAYLSDFFHIIYLIHKNDFNKLAKSFTISKDEHAIMLYPLDISKDYIKKIKIMQEQEEVKSITLYLNNRDYINIGIGNEIH